MSVSHRGTYVDPSDPPPNHGVRHVSDTPVCWRLVWSPVTTKIGRRSPVTTSHRKVSTGEHKIGKVFTREHLNAALKSTLMPRRVRRTTSRVYHASFRSMRRKRW